MAQASDMTGVGVNEIEGHPGSSEFKLVALRLAVLHEDVSDMKSVLKDLTQAITKLALIEERQAHTIQGLDRAFQTLEKVDRRLTVLEQRQPLNDQNTKWFERVSWGSFGLLAMYVLKKVGIIP